MRSSFLSLLSVCLCTFSIAFADNTITDKATGQVFPSEISFEAEGKNYQLQATGVTTRKKFFLNVYGIAHYLQKDAQHQSDKFQEILAGNYAEQLTMKWVRDVGADRVKEAFQESFRKVFGDEYGSLSGEINSFLKFFQNDAKAGDQYILRRLPEGDVEVILNGTKAGSLRNKKFAQGLWSIWFGPKSIVNRNELVDLM